MVYDPLLNRLSEYGADTPSEDVARRRRLFIGRGAVLNSDCIPQMMDVFWTSGLMEETL